MQILLIFQSSPEVAKCIVKEGECFLISIFLEVNTVKLPEINPGAYIFQRRFLRGLFLKGLIFGGAYIRGKIAFQNRL